MKVLVTGAQFHNKGAQSLLFSVMDMLRKKYDDVDIYFMPLDDIREYPQDTYKFQLVYGRWDAHMYENQPMKRPYIIALALVRRVIRKGSVRLRDVVQLHKILPEMDLVVDVSGYQLTSKFSNEANNMLLDYIDEAARYNIPIILMPQSFGPFNYERDKDKMLKRIASTLKKANLIFAREEDGKSLLEKDFNLTNVKLAPDLVLQAGELDWENIYYHKPSLNLPAMKTSGNVGIIPNSETVKHGNEAAILALYKDIIQNLLNLGKTVYIFRHSNDLDLCKKIYSEFNNVSNVQLIENDFDCIEYSEFVKSFDFIIASRYHAVVHAYKQNVPSIILGWAVKYSSLAYLFDQSQFVYDISSIHGAGDYVDIVQAVRKMSSLYLHEKEVIKDANRKMENKCIEACDAILK